MTEPTDEDAMRNARRSGPAAIALAATLASASPAGAQPSPEAQRAVQELRDGEQFYGDTRPFLAADGRLDGAALDLLARGLSETQGDARNELANALVAAARAGDPLARRGGNAIQDPRVVAVLVEQGLARPDGAKAVCLQAILESVPPALLAPHGAALLASLRGHPDALVALAVARARPADALPVLDEAARANRTFAAAPETALARAALGDAAAETALLERFRAEQDPERKAALCRDLGLVGSPAALKALGEALRTPLVVGSLARRRSVRLSVLAALRRAFPEEPALFWEQIRDDAGYAAAEAFVEQRLGVTWSAPRPPFLTETVAPF